MQVRLRETRWVWEFFRKGRRWTVRNVRGKNWKGLKIDQVCSKHVIFVTETSRIQVTKTSTQNTKKKTLENFLSVFRDWMFHSRESRELSRENLCVPLATGSSTRDQVANLSSEKHENPNFEKYSKSFSWLKHLPTNKSLVSREMDSRLGHAIGSTRNWVARTGQNNFCKNKVLSKNN